MKVRPGTTPRLAWLTIVGRPVGRSEPAVSVSGEIVSGNQLPSIVDVPAAGCWSFDMAWSHGTRQVSTIDLDVFPAGTQPVYT